MEPGRTGKTERRAERESRGSQVMSMLSARSPINPPRPASSSSLFFLPIASSSPILGFLMAPFLFVASGADPGDRPLQLVNAPVSAMPPPTDPCNCVARPSGDWGHHFPSAVHPSHSATRGSPEIHHTGAVPRDSEDSLPGGLAGRFHVCPRPAADHHAIVAHSGNSGSHPSRGGSPPTPCPSSWGIVFSETDSRTGAGLRRQPPQPSPPD